MRVGVFYGRNNNKKAQQILINTGFLEIFREKFLVQTAK
jgi:hypothetical protein